MNELLITLGWVLVSFGGLMYIKHFGMEDE